jgi:O-antigen/teichoic acid export membrane protein
VFPVFSRLSLTSVPPVGYVFERGVKLGLALTLPLAAGAFVLADPVVRTLYGPDYAEAADALRILAPAIALYPVCYVAGSLLVSQHRQRAMLAVYGLVAAENILANLVLIPWLSLEGAALATSTSQVLVTVALLAVARQAAGRVEWKRIAAGPVVATLAAALAMLVLRDSLAAAVAVGAAVYLCVLFVFERRLFPEDARAVLDLLPGRGAA